MSINENIAFGVAKDKIDNDLIETISRCSESYNFIQNERWL